jgi:hypothetical protein
MGVTKLTEIPSWCPWPSFEWRRGSGEEKGDPPEFLGLFSLRLIFGEAVRTLRNLAGSNNFLFTKVTLSFTLEPDLANTLPERVLLGPYLSLGTTLMMALPIRGFRVVPRGSRTVGCG